MAAHQPATGPNADRGPATAPLRLAAPARQLADAPLAVRVRGVPVGATVVLQLRARWWSGEHLVSSARYRSVDGTIDVSRDAPLEGYEGVEADGLLRTLVPLSAAGPPIPRRPGTADAVPTGRPGLAADVFELRAQVEAPGGDGVRATTHRDALGATVVTAVTPLPGSVATRYHEQHRALHGPAIVAWPLLGGAPAERAAALLASHGYVVLLLAARPSGDHLATVPTALLGAAEQALSRIVSGQPCHPVLLGLDVAPDRRSPAATRSWSALLDRLRDLRVAPQPPR